MVNIETLIFDIDGTLVDATTDIVKAMNFAIKTMGLHKREPAEIISYIGTGVEDLVKKTLGDADSAFFESIYELFTDCYEKHPADEATLYPHVKEVLEHFKNKRKIILTNRKAKSAEVVLKAMGIRDYFDKVFAADDENCRKPSICPLEKDPSFVNAEKNKMMIVGDMDVDVKAGKAGGLKTCWVSYGLGAREEIESLKPDFIIGDMAELKNIVR